jgi:hypothetical protein
MRLSAEKINKPGINAGPTTEAENGRKRPSGFGRPLTRFSRISMHDNPRADQVHNPVIANARLGIQFRRMFSVVVASSPQPRTQWLQEVEEIV